ncbi:dna mismatch repair protein msh3 [Lichtheimia corymbifera JMRC:FSU:9682]|uniref:DNA mismatch repair protein MSH3 n=1 Tax=Lichtheimia corymbifera JMRC:FSU:9682 TaxID=1263082 RepID=A0A068RIC6_9FUNG|nr:dna mismatch repair protein msh3 [Lichtheimia corymbifera JMRC:FSU:9682]
MSKRQLTLSSFFTKKTDTNAPNAKRPKNVETNDTGMAEQTTTPPSSSPIDSSPSNSGSPAKSPPRMHNRRDPEAAAKRHERFVEKFAQLERDREAKRRRVDTPQAYSPLELQVLELKRKHPGVLLAIEVGYKFRFFGEDAKIASRVLHIAHFVDRNFWVASIPTHRLAVHVRRLVHAGHKVGVVRQTETAALKAVGSNKSAPFQRELKQLYTKGTFVDEMDTVGVDEEAKVESSTSYLVCIVEEKRGGGGVDERVKIGLVAVQPATGDIMYDSFEDGYMRSELETRLLHIEPSELLLPHALSKATEKVISHMSGQRPTVFGDSVRIERMEENDKFSSDYNTAFTFVSNFYTQPSNHEKNYELRFSETLNLPDPVIKALASILRYLEEFGLEHALQLTKYFVHFSSRTHMLLNGNTLANLEIYRNSTDFTEKGSLFWILNHTKTRFGKRLLRKWVGRPLVDVQQLNERINAIEELLTTDNPMKPTVEDLLKHMPDLEKGLSRIHYGLSSPSELLQVLNALAKISHTFSNIQHAEGFQFESDLLNQLFGSLPRIYNDVTAFQGMINANAIDMPDCKLHLFRSEERWPEILRQKESIALVESELDEYLRKVKQSTGITGLQFVHVAGIEYLLEVKNTLIKKVPGEWIKISGTKAVSRFHTPFTTQKLKERERHKEQLVVAAENAYREFLREVSDKYETFRDVVLSLAQLDCLLSLATVARRPKYVKPTFSEHTQIKVVNGRHPMVEQFLSDSYVANDIDFDTNDINTMILTGPNMGGKSSYIRQVALIAIMGQIGSYVPADSAHLGILDAVYTRMGAFDNMLKGESTFLVELHEACDIMKQATPQSLVILDELGRGTSTHDGMAIAYAVLDHFITRIRSITLFVTHYPFLADIFPSAANRHMSFIEHGDDVVFLYKLVEGTSLKSYGLNVARMAGLPDTVLKVAKVKAVEMEKAIEAKQSLKDQRALLRYLYDPQYLSEHTDDFKKCVDSLLPAE